MTEARPSNVVWFERLMYLAIAIDAISTMIDWNRILALRPLGGNVFVLTIMTAGIGIRLLLVWLAVW